ncbi:glycoside hydrolase family 13 protein [Kocuria sp. p3-SID1433]|uniref:glycoside hydrolase family 13 protein n=1 Tax=unclassified Kocuria TaxID=2649579 RepID=UPI0021A3E656|nr:MULTISPECIES: glycoside hydrolase family 13 protein [unclassified Kocuria]MCT1601585.1 glycoside hydrolase family 13 protein [Kocuria sp. p3-SID1428]MCT2180438.1 glycoside hydrolase family 13 protein [Kocuria sp. p3-SID1433]
MSIPASEAPQPNPLWSSPDWWRQAVVYQVYPRSFQDADGDGLGDLRGVTRRADYLRDLGVDAVWLSPFYPSELADGGYDVADYRDVDPRLGTLEDFDELVAALHERQIKVVVDIVPNHSSDQHVWFQEALAAEPGSPERARYIFREGRGEHGELPPADWTSIFGGPAWTRVTEPDGTPGQWYLHLFASEQPDFDWSNPEVHQEFLTTLRFWSDRGVDGFRIDVAHGLAKDLPEQLPASAELPDEFESLGAHPFWDRDEVHEIYREWRQVFDEYDPPRTAVAEAWVHPDRLARYASSEGLGQAFSFDLLEVPFDASEFRRAIRKNLAEAARSGASSTWVLSNHDVVRHATRYGLDLDGLRQALGEFPRNSAGGENLKVASQQWLLLEDGVPLLDRELGERRARAAVMLLLALPGSAYLYQGEELGLHEVVEIAEHERQDPSFFRNPGVDQGRDGCRVPLPWDAEQPHYGFGGTPHLPQPEWFSRYAAAQEAQDPESFLSLYRQALSLRRQLQGDEVLEWGGQDADDVLHLARPGGWESVTNFGSEPVDLPEGEVLLTSAPLEDGRLGGRSTAWIRRG